MFKNYDLKVRNTLEMSSLNMSVAVFLLRCGGHGCPGSVKATKTKLRLFCFGAMATLEPIPVTYGQRARLRAHKCYTPQTVCQLMLHKINQQFRVGGGEGGRSMWTAEDADMVLASSELVSVFHSSSVIQPVVMKDATWC